MIRRLGSFLEVFDFSLQVFQVTLFALPESSLCSPVLRLAFLGGNVSTRLAIWLG